MRSTLAARLNGRDLLVFGLLAVACNNGDRVNLEGDECIAWDDCVNGLVCAHDGICRDEGAPGTLTKDSECAATTQCRFGLVCASSGVCADPGDPGTAGFDEACAETTDCQIGLTCSGDQCKGLQLPYWPGADCDATTPAPAYKVFFEVPDEGESLPDFYRLPYPNDIRALDDDRLDLSGHPSPGILLPLLGDVVGNMIRVIESESLGKFGANESVYFRFSAYPDSTTLTFGLPGQGTVALVDITPGASSGELVPFGYSISSGRTPYICENWIALTPNDGRPLEPLHTYAAILSTDILDKSGQAPVQDADFPAMLATDAPKDARLDHAWQAYAPLRTYLAAQAIDPSKVAAAAVFTVMDVTRVPKLVRAAVDAAPAPTLNDAVVCGDGADPFADPADATRGCTAASTVYTEIQATVPMPQFQEGTPPFKDFADGGGIAEPAKGLLTPIRSEDVHVAITLPKDGVMPVGGWPVIVYAHGTGGNYTSFEREGLAEALTHATWGETPVQFAMVSMDAPLHGPRAHKENFKQSWLDVDPDAYAPDVLFFNPLNPRAARDNALQEAADLWTLTRLLATLDLGAADSPTGAELRFDMSRLYFLGHSQGGVVGPMYAAYEPALDAVVLSGAGALTVNSLLDKTSPRDVANMVRVGLADASVSRTHPVLNLAQQLADTSDGVNQARYVLSSPLEGHTARSVLQVYGLGDTYSPESTQYALARALGVGLVANGNTPLQYVTTETFPVSSNLSGGVTGVAVLYAKPPTADAHFVLFERPEALATVRDFFSSAAVDGVPTAQ
jgi:predicted esterase